MGFAEACLAGHLAERQRLVKVGVDELAGLGNRGRFGPLLDNGDGFRVWPSCSAKLSNRVIILS